MHKVYTHCPYNATVVAELLSNPAAAAMPRSPPLQPMQPHSAARRSIAGKPTHMHVTTEMVTGVVGKMLPLAKTANGSSFLQSGLRSSADAYSLVYTELFPHFHSLLLHEQGCYVVRALLEMLADQEVTRIFARLAADIEYIVHLMCHSLHTRRVVQFFLEKMTAADTKMLASVVKANFDRIARTQHGCISLQRIMDQCSADSRAELMQIAADRWLSLAMDPFGNYLVQYLIDASDPELIERRFMEMLTGRVAALCCNKFGSNVTEKLFLRSPPRMREAIVTELLRGPATCLAWVVQDSFGNYIIQTMIDHVEVAAFWELYETVLPLLETSAFASKIRAKLVRRAELIGHCYPSGVSSEMTSPCDSFTGQ